MTDRPEPVEAPPPSRADVRSLGDGTIDVRRQRRSVLDLLDLFGSGGASVAERGWDVVLVPPRGRTRRLSSFGNEAAARSLAGQLERARLDLGR